MTARWLDGAALAARVREELRPKVTAFQDSAGRAPGLGVVLVGENPASEVYVRNKLRAASEIGCKADLIRLDVSARLEDVLAAVEALNRSNEHDGILVQSPLPPAMGPHASQAVFDAIDPSKDIDGFTPVSVGRLVQNRATLAPCTPLGIIELLDRSEIPIAGARAVVIGRSDIVGKPVALLLLHRHATVTICHSRSVDLSELTRSADIIVAAIGRPAFVRPEWVRPGVTVIDVGINRVTDPALVAELFPSGSPRREELERRGSVLIGDVHPAVAEVAGALSPVPGGVGPLTIAMLLANTLRAAEARRACDGSR